MFTHRYAFLIACEAYIAAGDRLRTPCQDIKEIEKVLREQYEFKTVTCINPTREQLLAFLQGIPDTVKTKGGKKVDTQVLIYYAGHGVAQEEERGIKGYLVPVDARRKDDQGQDILASTSVSMDEVVQVMEQGLQELAQQVLAVLDCCFAGSVRWSTATYRSLRTGEKGAKVRYRQQLAFYRRHRSLQILTSTSHNQKALDSLGVREDAQEQSPFARTLLQVLQEYRNRLLAIDDVKAYVNERLNQQYQLNQGAEIFPLQGHDSGTFLLLHKQFNDQDLPEKAFENPYKGLEAYEVKDAGVYFGREQAVEELVALVKPGKPLVVAGASGSGKSSLVQAGVVPRLLIEQGYHKNQILLLRPGREPMDELAHVTAVHAIVIVDQLEQLITQATDNSAEAVQQFLAHLQSLGQVVICTVRVDFEAQIFKAGELIDERFSLYRVQRLEREAIQRIIALPALRVGRFFYPEQLVQRIVDDFLSYPNSLPLLSLVLHELFEKGKHDPYQEIHPADYEDLNGLTGVLSKKLDAVYARFSSPVEASMLQNVLVRMTSLRGGRLAAKRVYASELTYADPDKQQVCTGIVALLTSEEYRLVVAGREEPGAQPYWEPSHDVVVQAWGTRREWIGSTNNGELALREELAGAVNDYQAHQQERAYLWNADPNLLLLGERPKAWWPQVQWDWHSYAQAFAKPREWFSQPEDSFVEQSFRRRKLQRAGVMGLMRWSSGAGRNWDVFSSRHGNDSPRTEAG